MTTTGKDTASFFENGTTEQFEYCYKLYPQVLQLKAEKRCKKPQELIRLDLWYQNELPKLIKARGKDAHMVYDELVQTMKWKQTRGKFYPQLSYLVKVNTPRAVMQETKKAFRKLPNLEQAITALSNLKGVGTTMASALLAAAAPDSAPFMADECLMAIPEIEGIDYTTKEYLNFVQHIQTTMQRLNTEVGGEKPVWSPHRVELALWSHYVANDLSPELLDEMPSPGTVAKTNGSAKVAGSENVGEKAVDGAGEDTNDEESLGAAVALGNTTATESETEQENTNPARQDGDSNFVSNDSTSQEPIMDENTTQTTATTTSSTDDGEAGTTPLASDSESNIEAPAKTNNKNGNSANSVLNLTAAGVTPPPPTQAGADTAAAASVELPTKTGNNNVGSTAKEDGSESLTPPAAGTAPDLAPAQVATAAVGNGNGSLQPALSVGGVIGIGGDSLDGENSCQRSGNDFEDDDNEEEDEDVEYAAGQAEQESNSRVDESSAVHKLSNAVNTCSAVKAGDSTTTQSSNAATLPAVAQKRSALHCAIDGVGSGESAVGVSLSAGGEEPNSQPDMKKLRSD